MPTAPRFQCHSLPAELFPSYFHTCPFTLLHFLCLGSRLICFAAKGTPCKMKTPPAKNFFPCMSGMSLCPAFRHRLGSLWHQFFGTIALMEFVLKPRSLLSRSSLPTELSPSCFPRFPVHPCRRFHLAPSQRSSPKAVSTVSRPSLLSLPPNGALPKSYFPRFPVRPPCRRFRLAPSQQSSPQAISHGFPSVHPVVASISFPPNGGLPKLFPTVSRPSTLSSLPYRSARGKVN